MLKPLAFCLLLSVSAQAACITDDTGEKVCLDAAPTRAVSLYGAFTETLWAVGAGQTLVAKTKSDDTIPQMSALPSVGTGLKPDVEYLLALKPDLVLSRAGKATGETLTMLRARGLRVAAFDPHSVEEVFGVIERLGVLWGREKEADDLAKNLKQRIDNIPKVAGNIKKPRVVFEVRSEPLSVAGSEGLVNDLIRVAGGENAVTQPQTVLAYDVEALLAADPDFYIVQEGPMNKKPLPPAERPNIGQLRAVRAGHVAVVDELLVSRPGPRVAEAAEALSRILHPELWRDSK
jgi:iron complex transport system substrate-binding protein